MTKNKKQKYRKIKQNEFYLITIVLLYAILLFLIFISLSAVIYYSNNNFITKFILMCFIYIYALHKVNFIKKFVYKNEK